MRPVFTLFFLVTCYLGQAQKETSHWFFGNGCYLHFSDTGLVVDSVDFFSFESSSSIAKANGDLLLYSNNWNFYDSNGDSIGKTPFGHTSASQGLVFLKSPTTNKVPFLSTESLEKESPIRVAYGNVNLASNKVEDVKVILDNGTEKVCAVNHRNNRYVWSAIQVAQTDTLFSFLHMPDSTLCCPRTNITLVDLSGNDKFSKTGQAKFSPNGRYLAMVNFTSSSEMGYFNDEIGKYEWKKYLGSTNGVEFSANSKNVLVENGNISVLPIDTNFKLLPHQTVGSYVLNSFRPPSFFQLTPSGSIMRSVSNSSSLDVINNPGDFHMSVTYSKDAIHLYPGSICRRGIPIFNASFFKPGKTDFMYTENCVTNEYNFEGINKDGAVVFSWRFKHIETGEIDEMSGKKVSYTFKQDTALENLYEVRLITFHNNKLDTAIKRITIRPKLDNGFWGADTFYCEHDSLVLRVPENMHCVHWMGEEPNMDIRKGPIVPYEHFHTDSMIIKTPGTYYAKITNKSFCTVYDTILVSRRPGLARPYISDATDSLSSSLEAPKYRWFVDGEFYRETSKHGISPTKNGYYQVQIMDGVSCPSELSDSFLVDWVSIENVEIEDQVRIFPNPSTGTVTIQSFDKSINHFVIFSSIGRTLMSVECNTQSQSVDLRGLTSGIYFVRFRFNDGSVAERELQLVK